MEKKFSFFSQALCYHHRRKDPRDAMAVISMHVLSPSCLTFSSSRGGGGKMTWASKNILLLPHHRYGRWKMRVACGIARGGGGEGSGSDFLPPSPPPIFVFLRGGGWRRRRRRRRRRCMHTHIHTSACACVWAAQEAQGEEEVAKKKSGKLYFARWVEGGRERGREGCREKKTRDFPSHSCRP